MLLLQRTNLKRLIAPLTLPIVSIQGGLGNQLCQWSFAHSVCGSSLFQIDSLHTNMEMHSRSFELEDVLKNCDHVKRSKSGELGVPITRTFYHFLDRMWEFKCLRFFVELLGYFREDPRVDQEQSHKIPQSLRYAKGYFQRQENVEGNFEAVQEEIVPVVNGILPNLKKNFGLISTYSVMHIRRGDYEAAEFTPDIIGTLSDEYFLNWTRGLDSENLVLLTEDRNDIADLVHNLKPLLVLDKLDTTPWETLAIMSGASRFLGSNSSLSWWGARLCSYNGGEVWLPSEWSFWKNINMDDYHFLGCNIANAFWVQGTLES